MSEWKVGDEIAFRGRNRIFIHKVERITPSGRLVCSPYTLNPDLSVRGASAYSQIFRGEPVTPGIRAVARKQRNLSTVTNFDASKASDELIASIADLIRQAKASESAQN